MVGRRPAAAGGAGPARPRGRTAGGDQRGGDRRGGDQRPQFAGRRRARQKLDAPAPAAARTRAACSASSRTGRSATCAWCASRTASTSAAWGTWGCRWAALLPALLAAPAFGFASCPCCARWRALRRKQGRAFSRGVPGVLGSRRTPDNRRRRPALAPGGPHPRTPGHWHPHVEAVAAHRLRRRAALDDHAGGFFGAVELNP
jgi:hypothetical protein